MATLRLDSKGSEVGILQQKLKELGFNPGDIDGDFGPATEAALIGFQRSLGLLPDGIAGPRTLKALRLAGPEDTVTFIPGVTVAVVARMFPFTFLGNIKANLPQVLSSLVEHQLDDRPIVLMALSTIRAETESFEPIAEGRSRFNTSPNGDPYDLYDFRRDLGNLGPPDGERFRGRERTNVHCWGSAWRHSFGPEAGRHQGGLRGSAPNVRRFRSPTTSVLKLRWTFRSNHGRVGRKSVNFASTPAENRRLVTREDSCFYGSFRSEPTAKEFS